MREGRSQDLSRRFPNYVAHPLVGEQMVEVGWREGANRKLETAKVYVECAERGMSGQLYSSGA